MKIAITGSTGLIGTALAGHFAAEHEILRLVRRDPRSPAEIRWDPAQSRIDAARLEGIDALIHLAAEPIAPRRWTRKARHTILRSRVDGTALVARTIAGLSRPPQVFLSASGIGYYGDTGSTPVDESAPAGRGFLAEICTQWEAATQPAADAGIRTVPMRIGAVLSPKGGALKHMLPAFRLGLGGRLGHGRQYFSWISITDLARAIEFLLTSNLAGPVNLCVPEPPTNREFTRDLGRALRRPAILPMPAPVLRAIFGQMAQETLLATGRVIPRRLLDAGFRFERADLRTALPQLLGKP